MCFSTPRKIKFYSGYLCPKMNKEIKANVDIGRLKGFIVSCDFFFQADPVKGNLVFFMKENWLEEIDMQQCTFTDANIHMNLKIRG